MTSDRVVLKKGYKPRKNEKYMSAQQQEYFRQKLLAWREELVEESRETISHLQSEVRDVGDEAERATRETENSLELRTRDRYRKLIRKRPARKSVSIVWKRAPLPHCAWMRRSAGSCGKGSWASPASGGVARFRCARN